MVQDKIKTFLDYILNSKQAVQLTPSPDKDMLLGLNIIPEETTSVGHEVAFSKKYKVKCQ